MNRRKPLTAEELMKHLHADPEYVDSVEQIEQNRLAREAHLIVAAQPILADLRTVGCTYDSLDHLRESGAQYREAIPILVRWLPLVKERPLRTSLSRTLMVPWANPEAIRPLLDVYKIEPDSDWTGHKFLLARALEIIADENMVDELAELVQDPHHGASRTVLVRAIGKMKNPKIIDVLIGLLDDEQVYGSALQALRQIGSEQARPHFERFLTHWSKNLQKEARKGLEKLDKKAAKKK